MDSRDLLLGLSYSQLWLFDRRNDGFPYPLDEVDDLYEASLAKFESYLAKKTTSSHGCTLENAAKRREWYDKR